MIKKKIGRPRKFSIPRVNMTFMCDSDVAGSLREAKHGSISDEINNAIRWYYMKRKGLEDEIEFLRKERDGYRAILAGDLK